MPADNLYANNRPEILKQLDDFNTADMSEGILQGILNEQFSEQAEQEQRISRTEDRQEERIREPKTAAPEEKEPLDLYAPLNTSIQQLASQQQQSYSELQQELAAMRQVQQEERRQYQQTQQQFQQQNYDQEAPVSYGQYARLEQAHNEVRGYLGQQHAQSQYQRAQNEYLMYKINNPDYALTPAEFNQAYRKFVGNEPAKAASVDWAGVHAKSHMDQRQPQLMSENDRLRKENEDLKKRLDSGSRRQAPAQDARAVSPAIKPAGRAVSSPLNSSDGADVVNLSSFGRGKSFKNYGRELVRGGFLG